MLLQRSVFQPKCTSISILATKAAGSRAELAAERTSRCPHAQGKGFLRS